MVTLNVGIETPASQVRHVTADGSDSNQGLNPGFGKASVQAAYNDLKQYALDNFPPGRQHVGRIIIHPKTDGYDVGDGLVLSKSFACDFVGSVMGRVQANYQTLSKLTTTSSTITQMVSLLDSDNGYGFKFLNLGFVADLAVSPLLTAMIRTNDLNFTDVKGCWATVANGPMAGWFIDTVSDPSQDNSWWTVENNRIHNMGLMRHAGEHNNNRWWVAHNQVFGLRSGAGMPGVDGLLSLSRVNDGVFINNNLESANVGIRVVGGENNLFLNNAGEADSYTNPFYLFVGSTSHTVIGGRVTIAAAASQSGIFIRAETSSEHIMVINPGLLRTSDAATARKDRIQDVSDNQAALTVLGRYGFGTSQEALTVPDLNSGAPIAGKLRDGSLWYDGTADIMYARINSGNRQIPMRDVTQNRGVGTIADTASSVTVAHGLPAAPLSVVVTGNGNEELWVTGITASTFAVNRAGTAGVRSCYWQAMR